MNRVVTEQAKERLKGIHQLSQRYNQMVGKAHKDRLLDLIRKHAEEIGELMVQNDAHYLVETGDLLVLCFEMLLEEGISLDETMNLCFERYEKKLTQLIEEERDKR